MKELYKEGTEEEVAEATEGVSLPNDAEPLEYEARLDGIQAELLRYGGVGLIKELHNLILAMGKE